MTALGYSTMAALTVMPADETAASAAGLTPLEEAMRGSDKDIWQTAQASGRSHRTRKALGVAVTRPAQAGAETAVLLINR